MGANTRKDSLLALAVVSQLGLIGCDGGMYSPTTAGDGSVVVVNRLTGSVKKVDGNKVVELPITAAPTEVAAVKVEDWHPTLASTTITQQPVTVGGRAKYRAGNMLLIIALEPANPSMKDDEWRAWRNHMVASRSLASFHITFIDRDGFAVLEHDLRFGEMTTIVDGTGDMTAFEDRIKIPMTADDYRAISGWDVTWSGWPPYFAPPVKVPDTHATKP